MKLILIVLGLQIPAWGIEKICTPEIHEELNTEKIDVKTITALFKLKKKYAICYEKNSLVPIEMRSMVTPILLKNWNEFLTHQNKFKTEEKEWIISSLKDSLQPYDFAGRTRPKELNELLAKSAKCSEGEFCNRIHNECLIIDRMWKTGKSTPDTEHL